MLMRSIGAARLMRKTLGRTTFEPRHISTHSPRMQGQVASCALLTALMDATRKLSFMRSSIAAIVRTLQPYDTLEAEHIRETLRWIASGAPLCRIQKPATPPQHLVSYFVLFDPATQQLL